MSRTSRHDEFTATAPIRWGEGKIDAAAGVAYLQTATGIQDLARQMQTDKDTAYWYTIDGRRLSGKPTAAGLYINGKRIILVR